MTDVIIIAFCLISSPTPRWMCLHSSRKMPGNVAREYHQSGDLRARMLPGGKKVWSQKYKKQDIQRPGDEVHVVVNDLKGLSYSQRAADALQWNGDQLG